jgi:hypothetical protein
MELELGHDLEVEDPSVLVREQHEQQQQLDVVDHGWNIASL